MRGRDAGESQRQPATAYASFLCSFHAEPAHQGKHRRAALPGASVAHKRDERPATRCRHGDDPGRAGYGCARDSPWAPPGAAASRPLANGSQAHRSLTMHLAGPTIAERAVSRRHLGEHPARSRGRWRRGLRPTPTARGPAGTRSASCNAANGPACVHPAVAQICDFLSAYLGSSVFGGFGNRLVRGCTRAGVTGKSIYRNVRGAKWQF